VVPALGLWRFAIYAALALAIFGSLAYAKHSYDAKQQEIGAAPWRDKYNALVADVEKQKKEAAEVLKVETEKAAKVSKSWADYARSSDDEYEKKIAAIRAAANSANGMRLISPERWNSSACATAGKDDTGASKENAGRDEFFRAADQLLRNEAARADEVATWAKSCFEYVNKEP
jgi:hypothetical protein